MTSRHRRPERATATILAVAVLVVAATAALVLAGLGGRVVSAERASATADAVALAGVTGGRGAALAVASANDSVLGTLQARGPVTVVRIGRDGVAATAAARPALR